MDEQAKPKNFFQKWLFPILVLVLMAGFLIVRGSSGSGGPGIVWGENYATGMGQAKDQNKAVLLAFTTTWCTYCNQMKKTTYKDDKVKALVEDRFVPIYLDAEKETALAEKYGVYGLPAFYVLKPDGTTVESFSGYYDAGAFAGVLEKALGDV